MLVFFTRILLRWSTTSYITVLHSVPHYMVNYSVHCIGPLYWSIVFGPQYSVVHCTAHDLVSFKLDYWPHTTAGSESRTSDNVRFQHLFKKCCDYLTISSNTTPLSLTFFTTYNARKKMAYPSLYANDCQSRILWGLHHWVYITVTLHQLGPRYVGQLMDSWTYYTRTKVRRSNYLKYTLTILEHVTRDIDREFFELDIFFKRTYLNHRWVTMTLFCTHGRVSGLSSLLDLEVMAPRGYSVPCQFWPVVRRHGRGVLWAGGDPRMTGCLECPLVSQYKNWYWWSLVLDYGTPERAWPTTMSMRSKA